jgi:hypothetical protein
MHMEGFRIILYLLYALNYLLFKDLLALFHLRHLLVERFPALSRTLSSRGCLILIVIIRQLILRRALKWLRLMMRVLLKPLLNRRLRLVLVTLDHLLEVLLHGQLARPTTGPLHLLSVLLVDDNSI